jgi:hypothetical protein
MLQSKALTFNS